MTLDPYAVRAWTTQRMANRLPSWARARLEEDSVAQTILNPPAYFFDDMVANTMQAGLDYYMPSVSLSEIDFLYEMALPMDFAFSYEEHEEGKLSFLPPTVTATDGSETVSVVFLERNKSDAIDVDYLLPTRMDVGLSTSAPVYIVAPTLASALGTAVINNTGLSDIGTVFVEVSGAEVFGTRDNRGDLPIPKVIIKGIPYMFGQKETEEHIPFLTNMVKKSKYNWQTISSVEVRGVSGDNTTVNLTSGFNRESVSNPYAVVVTVLDEFPQVLSFENYVYGAATLPCLQYKTFEQSSVDLLRQGNSEKIVEHEVLLTYQGGTQVPPIVDIELLPNSRWLAALTSTEVLLFDTRMPHHLNIIPEIDRVESLIAKANKEKSLHPEMRLMTDKHDCIMTETDGYVNLTTWHKKRLRPVLEVRLSCEILGPSSTTAVKKQFDSSGVAYDIGSAPNDGWIQSINGIDVYNPTPRITDWRDISWAISPLELLGSPLWVALFKLEVKLTDGLTETDTALLWCLPRGVEASFTIPDTVLGVVDGLSFDANHDLVIHTTTNSVYAVHFSYDYFLVDYYGNKIWFLNEYDSVAVTS